jgi:hypothetical protein
MVYEDADATLLRLFECFMESAPQLVLQIYILLRDQGRDSPNLKHFSLINNPCLDTCVSSVICS